MPKKDRLSAPRSEVDIEGLLENLGHRATDAAAETFAIMEYGALAAGMWYWNTTLNEYRVYDGAIWDFFSSGEYAYHYEADGLDNTLVTVLPAGTVGSILKYSATGEEVTGAGVIDADGNLTPGNAIAIYNDGVDVLTLSVTVGGAIQIRRTAGADAFNVTIDFMFR